MTDLRHTFATPRLAAGTNPKTVSEVLGPNKGSPAAAEANERPDPSSDRADEGEIGTAYRIPSEPSHASQPRSASTSKRRMRRKKHDP
jgi:hypothetical protein